ncbi:hypothetical protein Ddc_20944 [Ditylenchus destructor]|nr:hypothetical protein Ddc_20944 [Ditylenchus destructor]
MKVNSAGILIEILLILDLFSSLMSENVCEWTEKTNGEPKKHEWTQCKITGIFIKNHKCPGGICVPHTTHNGVKVQCCKPDSYQCAHCDKKNGDLKCKAAAKRWKKGEDGKLRKKTHKIRCNSGCCQIMERVKRQKVSTGGGGGTDWAWTYMWMTMFLAP